MTEDKPWPIGLASVWIPSIFMRCHQRRPGSTRSLSTSSHRSRPRARDPEQTRWALLIGSGRALNILGYLRSEFQTGSFPGHCAIQTLVSSAGSEHGAADA